MPLTNPNDLEKSILKTIAYYDIFDYPLTAMELWQSLWQYKCQLSELIFCLATSKVLKQYLETRNGFYFLKGKKALLNIRAKRRIKSIQKWQKALRAVRVIRFVPFVEAVFLCNSISYFNAQEDSDIDFLIIIKEGYIWLSRFWITIYLHIFRMRRHGKKIKDRICLSFYITDKSLNLKKFYDQGNIHLYYWLKNLNSIFDRGIGRKFFTANIWLKKYFPNNIEKDIVDTWIIKDNFFSSSVRGFQEFVLNTIFGRFLNFCLKKMQLIKMSFNTNSRINEDNDFVIVNDQMLKFHESGLEKINKLLAKMKRY